MEADMRKAGSVAIVAVMIALAAPAQLKAQAQTPPAPEEPIDLLEALGVRLPQGEALAGMIAEAERHPLGSRQNPVRTAGVPGQHAYLARLRCADGKRPRYERAFSDGIGPFGRIMDIYNLWCGEERGTVRLDLYHPDHVEVRPIPGFTIVPAAASPTAPPR
jgi:hypothetical protein